MAKDIIKAATKVALSIYDGRVSFNTSDFANSILVQGKICVISFNVIMEKLLGANETTILTLPTECCPAKTSFGFVINLSDRRIIPFTITPYGNLSIIHQGSVPAIGDNIVGATTWWID